MFSKARVVGRPIHPMLVVFPIALFASTIALELAEISTGDPFFYRGAMIANLAGLVLGVFAVVPGLIDRYALPVRSRSRGLANQHAWFMVVTLVMFAVSGAVMAFGWTGRLMVDGVYVFDLHVPLALDLVGVVSMVTGAMLGWSLVQTHHVGIKPALVLPDRPSREPELESALLYRTN